ncbi:hypothetical protein LJR118_002140 [Acidovorax sp. LjRoot118]|uniref:hypothetical protein n=1 Tax=Acidovorax sp. LjRoot118 TaxID=3342256 RepID=UPI003ECE0EC2
MTARTLQPRTYVPPAGPTTLRICRLLDLRGPMPTRDIHAALSDTHTRNGVGQVIHHAVRSQLLTCNRSVFPHTFDVAAGWEAKAAAMAPRAKVKGQPAATRAAAPSKAKPARRPTPRMRPAPARRVQRAAPAPRPIACVPPPLTTVQHARITQPTSVWALGVHT